MEIRPVGA